MRHPPLHGAWVLVTAGDSLPDTDHVVRYCSPSRVSSDGRRPTYNAFLPDSDGYLSVHWLEYFGASTTEKALAEVREAARYTRRPNGRYARLCIGEAKKVVKAACQRDLDVRHMPTDDPSHAGIVGYVDEDELDIAKQLSRLVAEEDVYPAVTGG